MRTNREKGKMMDLLNAGTPITIIKMDKTEKGNLIFHTSENPSTYYVTKVNHLFANVYEDWKKNGKVKMSFTNETLPNGAGWMREK